MESLNASTLRRILRVIHCLQKERGASCAHYLMLHHKMIPAARRAVDRAMADLQLPTVQCILEKIRKSLDNASQAAPSFHRTLVSFNTLISAVLHEHILRFTAPSSQRQTNPIEPMARVKSHGFLNLLDDSEVIEAPRRVKHRKQKSLDFASLNYGAHPSDPMWQQSTRDESALPDGAHTTSSCTFFLRPTESSAPHETGVMLKDNNHDDEDTRTRLHSLLQLLDIFVRLKESTGVERATLCSMLSTSAQPTSLLNDVVLEVENQRKQLKKLAVQHIGPNLRNLVQELVWMSHEMVQVQELVLSGYCLDSLRQEYDAEKLWNVLTLYIDKLHSLELLIVEEIENCMPPVSTYESTAEWSVLVSAFGQRVVEEAGGNHLANMIENMPAEEIKRRLLSALNKENNMHQVAIEDYKNVDLVSKGVDELLLELTDAPASKEWEIDIYELRFLKRIGQGAGGTTYIADWSGQTVAVKVASITETGLDGWRTEVNALQKLHHPNIIRLLGSVYHQHPLTFCLVLEYCDGGDLATALKRTTPKNFFFHVASGVAKGLVYVSSLQKGGNSCLVVRNSHITNDAFYFTYKASSPAGDSS
jgi:hypothetical protein